MLRRVFDEQREEKKRQKAASEAGPATVPVLAEPSRDPFSHQHHPDCRCDEAGRSEAGPWQSNGEECVGPSGGQVIRHVRASHRPPRQRPSHQLTPSVARIGPQRGDPFARQYVLGMDKHYDELTDHCEFGARHCVSSYMP